MIKWFYAHPTGTASKRQLKMQKYCVTHCIYIYIYELALKESKHKHRMEFKEPPAEPEALPKRKRQRKRNVLWFNPPHNDNVVTDVARRFLELLDTFIHRDHAFRCLFNRCTVKVSYCTMRNMKANVFRSTKYNILEKIWILQKIKFQSPHRYKLDLYYEILYVLLG